MVQQLIREGREVQTRLGRGRVVYEFTDGQVAVELEHGGGQLFPREELFPPAAPARRRPAGGSHAGAGQGRR